MIFGKPHVNLQRVTYTLALLLPACLATSLVLLLLPNIVAFACRPSGLAG